METPNRRSQAKLKTLRSERQGELMTQSCMGASSTTSPSDAMKHMPVVTPPVGDYVRVLGVQPAPNGGFYRVLTPAAPSRVSDEQIARAIEAVRSTRRRRARGGKDNAGSE